MSGYYLSGCYLSNYYISNFYRAISADFVAADVEFYNSVGKPLEFISAVQELAAAFASIGKANENVTAIVAVNEGSFSISSAEFNQVVGALGESFVKIGKVNEFSHAVSAPEFTDSII